MNLQLSLLDNERHTSRTSVCKPPIQMQRMIIGVSSSWSPANRHSNPWSPECIAHLCSVSCPLSANEVVQQIQTKRGV